MVCRKNIFEQTKITNPKEINGNVWGKKIIQKHITIKISRGKKQIINIDLFLYGKVISEYSIMMSMDFWYENVYFCSLSLVLLKLNIIPISYIYFCF